MERGCELAGLWVVGCGVWVVVDDGMYVMEIQEILSRSDSDTEP